MVVLVPRHRGGDKEDFSAGTFNELTVGPTIKPELRYDAALSGGSRPFGNQDARSQLTFSLDAILAF